MVADCLRTQKTLLESGGLREEKEIPTNSTNWWGLVNVGLAGFEPTTSAPPVQRATKLRYSPY